MADHNDNTNKKVGWNVKPAKTLPHENMKGRININPEKYDKLLKQQGTRVKVYRTMYCPNVKSIDGGEHNIECEVPSCNGSGFIDVRPIETIAFIQNQTLEKLPLAEGFVDGNQVAMTFLLGIELQYFTLIELCDHTDIYFQRVKRSVGDIDVLKYKGHRINVVMDQFGVEFFQGTDFVLDPNGNIRWCESKGPDVESIYSVHYETSVQFRATRAMHSNRFSQHKTPEGLKQIKLQEQWQCTKEFLVKRSDLDGNEILPNPINPPDDD